MVMAQALFMHLKSRSPAAEIDVVAPGWSVPLLERMPEVRKGIDLGLGHGELRIAKRRALGIRLRERAYDWAIVLPRSLKAALVPAFARIPRRTGFRGEYRYGLLNDIRPFDKAVLNQTVRRFVALGSDELPDPIPQPRLQVDEQKAAALFERFEIDAHKPRIVIAPGAEYGSAKRWPADAFGKLAQQLTADGYEVIILGSQKERALGEEIHALAESPHVKNLCGLTELVDAVDLLGTAQAAVCNDSGLLHVAAASGAPLVALYGSSSPYFTPPLTENARVIYEALSCSPCFKRECPLGHLDCLRKIEPSRVRSELNGLVATGGAA
jgi:heptosyltransferase-2